MLSKKFSLLLIFSIILTLGLSISLSSLLAAWTPPASAPPEGNIAKPLNEGETLQAKKVGLWLNYLPLGGGGSVNGLLVQYGKVGIGLTEPTYKLDVDGDMRFSGTLQGGTVPWARLSSFPTACTAGQYVTAVGSSLTCSTPVGSGDITGVAAGTGLSGGGVSGDVTLTADVTYLQRRVSSSCTEGSSIRVINADGTVSCETDDGGGVNSVSNANGTLTISPTTGAVIASLNLGNANTWTGTQTFSTLQTSQTNISTNVINAQGAATEIAVNYNSGKKGFTAYNGGTGSLFRVDGTSGDVNVAQKIGVNMTPVYPLDVFGDMRFSGTLQGGTVPWARISGYPGESDPQVNTLTSGKWCTTDGSAINCTSDSPVGGVSSVSNSNGTLTISPTTGAVVASLNLGNANTWTADQTLSANLTINGTINSQLNHNTNNPLYINSYDALQLRINFDGGTGDFGINNSGNSRIFTVTDDGHVTIGGTNNKLTVGTIDPVFNIGGEKYSTYAPDYAGGTRIETSGVIQLDSENKYMIDFNDLEKGSDLWLFWQASNKDLGAISVLLTPSFESAAWYEKDGNKVIIYGRENGEVSYRLSAPRVDYKKWGNMTEDQTLEGINVSDY